MDITPNIPLVNTEPGKTVQNWGFFTKDEVALAAANGSLLVLDIDLGGKCSHGCPYCNRKNNPVDDFGGNSLTYDELLRVIDDARELNLKVIKWCGAGEPFENPRLLRLAQDLTERGVGLGIFTKGHVLGRDPWVEKVHGPQIKSGRELAERLFALKVSILLNYPTFDGYLADALVGRKIRHYPLLLKQTAEILAQAGFNKTTPPRFAAIHAPLTSGSIGGAYRCYKFWMERNILPVIAMHMSASRRITKRYLLLNDPTWPEKLALFEKIYGYNIHRGIDTLEQLQRDGVSAMPGIHPCNQIAVGLYVTLKGHVIRCPGDFHAPLGNVREESITDIWNRARRWEYEGRRNCGCPYKEGITLPADFQRQVINKLARKWLALT